VSEATCTNGKRHDAFALLLRNGIFDRNALISSHDAHFMAFNFVGIPEFQVLRHLPFLLVHNPEG